MKRFFFSLVAEVISDASTGRRRDAWRRSRCSPPTTTIRSWMSYTTASTPVIRVHVPTTASWSHRDPQQALTCRSHSNLVWSRAGQLQSGVGRQWGGKRKWGWAPCRTSDPLTTATAGGGTGWRTSSAPSTQGQWHCIAPETYWLTLAGYERACSLVVTVT